MLGRYKQQVWCGTVQQLRPDLNNIPLFLAGNARSLQSNVIHQSASQQAHDQARAC
jgi:hypothetical protein